MSDSVGTRGRLGWPDRQRRGTRCRQSRSSIWRTWTCCRPSTRTTRTAASAPPGNRVGWPGHRSGLELLGYPQVQLGLRDRRFRSPAGLTLEIQGITEGPLWDRVITGILSLDGEDHTRLRRLVGQAFTPRSADRLRDSMRRIFTDLVAAAEAGGQCDLVTDVCQVLPDRRDLRAARRAGGGLAAVLAVGRRRLQDLPAERGRGRPCHRAGLRRARRLPRGPDRGSARRPWRRPALGDDRRARTPATGSPTPSC